jgi:hypothetical protein
MATRLESMRMPRSTHDSAARAARCAQRQSALVIQAIENVLCVTAASAGNGASLKECVKRELP